MQRQHLMMRGRPGIKGVVRLHRDADKSLEAVAERAQIDACGKSLNDFRVFEPAHTLGHCGRRQMNSTPDFRVREARVVLQKREYFPVIRV